MQDKPLRIVQRPQHSYGIVWHLGRWRDVRQNAAVRAAEPKLAIRLSFELVTLLVDGPMVPATEHREI